MTQFAVGDKVSLKIKKVNATHGKWIRETDSYEMLDNVNVGIVHITTGGRGWSSENYAIALVDPDATINLKVIEVVDRVAKCKLLTGGSLETVDFAKRPYVRKNGIANPQVKQDIFDYVNTFGKNYGVFGSDEVYVAFRHLETT